MGRWLHGFACLAVVFVCAASGLGQEVAAEDEEEDKDNAVTERFELPESYFDSWAFSDGKTAEDVRAEQERLLTLRIDDVHRTVPLSDAQRVKLDLAGRGDIQRYFEDLEVVRRKFLIVRTDRQRYSEISTDLQPLQTRIAAGLFGTGSLFHKTLRRALDAEGLALYERHQRERRGRQYRAKVEWVVAMLDNALALTEHQRQGITRVLLAETRPSVKMGDMDHYVILSQMALLPEEMLRPFFQDAQWKALQVQFQEVRNLEKYLREQGYLTLDDEYAPPTDLPSETSTTKP